MKSGVLVLTAVVACAACASARNHGDGDDEDDIDAAGTDAPAGDGGDDVDAPVGPVDAPTDGGGPPSNAAPLILTEISLAPNGGELVELFNPTAATVTLRNYYLTDVPTYFRLPSAAQSVDASDFIVRFPAGATVGPGAVVTVAMDTAANFMTATGAAPTFSVAGGTIETVDNNGAATLTNGGEPVVLFFWDGASDRVTDVDIMIAGAPSAANALVNKSGVVVDGPDADTSGSAYATDAMTIAGQAAAPGSALSTKRLVLETGSTEIQVGNGNGVMGQDETSEQTATTWDATAFTALTPGAVPAALAP